MHTFSVFTLASLALLASSRSLLEAVSAIPELSNFTSFYTANEPFATLVFGNSSQYPITVLVPNDDAFAAYQSQHGMSFSELSPDILLPLVQYHTLVSSLSRENFTGNVPGSASSLLGGTTVPTLMTSLQYNDRSVGAALAAKFGGIQRSSGQVVIIAPKLGSTSRFLLSRQSSGVAGSVRSGLSSDVNLTTLDDEQGIWDGGRFHMIDNFLTPPDLCKTTIRQAGLSALDNALNRSKSWDKLDNASNVTCLGPSNEAFASAGNADRNLNESTLSKALMFHTLPEVAYSDYLYDGQEFTSLDNLKVRVKVEGEGAERQIWFNNAKVVGANNLAHNGLMHILDAVMKPLDQLDSTTSTAPKATQTASATATASSGAAGQWLQLRSMDWTFMGVMGLVATMNNV